MSPEELRERFRMLASQYGPGVSVVAKVKKIDTDNFLCTLEDEDFQEILDVRLRPVQSNNKSIMMLPAVGSYVLAVRIESENQWFVIGYDKLSLINLQADNTVFEMDAAGFLLKKENESLKAVLIDLVDCIKKISFPVTTSGNATNHTGSTGSLVNLTDFEKIETRINTLLK